MDRTPPTRRLVLAGGLAAGAAGCQPALPVELPAVALPGLDGLTTRGGWPVPGIAARQFVGRVSLLTVWATWCPPCRGEHPTLMRLAGDGRFPLVGLLYADKPERAVAYLRREGNPFAAVSPDDGVLVSVLGQRGVPATYVVDRGGRAVHLVLGGMDSDRVRADLMPAVRRALAG